MRALSIILIFFSFLTYGQGLTFLNQQTSLDSVDKFMFVINNDSFTVTEDVTIIKIKNGTRIKTEIDFGSHYQIYKMGYLLHHKRVYFVFFIRENELNYTTLYSFKLKNLQSVRRIHLIESFELISHHLKGKHLLLKFKGATYDINLKRDLRKPNIIPEYHLL